MNYELKNLPERTTKPRQYGFTMAMDKGLSIRAAEDFASICADHVDIVKLGWATSFVTPNLKDKLKVYKEAGIPVYFGGTLFEAFVIRNQFDDYRRLLDKFDMSFAEVSDGSIELDHDKKCDYIVKLSEQVTVLSEVGSKDADKIIPPYMWIDLMQKELDAGAWKVQARSQPVQATCAALPRPPNTIEPVAPSSSGIATMMVDSTGISPRSEAPHCSSVCNSAGWAAI